MERYEIIFRHARFEHDFPSEIKEKLDEWRSSRFSEEDDYENWKKQDLINEIATFLWSAKKMRKLEEYSSKFEIGGEEENIFKHLLELCHEIEGESDRFEKDFLYAQGFCLVYEFDIAVTQVKNLPAKQETWVQSLGWEDPLEKEMGTHSSILAWRIPWMEEPGRLQSMSRKELDTTE